MLARKPNAYSLSDLPQTGTLEALEPRITPASFFIGAEGSVVDSHGNAVEQFTDNGASDWADTLASAGADSSYFFKKGDTLSFDSNGNGKVDAGERVLLEMKGGAAVFFLDTDNEGAEIAGISASDKFGAELDGVVGGIVTSLVKQGSGKSTTYDFTTQVQTASIKGLLINGYMSAEAGIWAGGDISSVKITGADEATQISASKFMAGSYAYNAAIGELVFAQYVANPGENGASISKIWAAGSIQEISAGDGRDAADEGPKNGGAGGSVKDVVLGSGRGDMLIQAGWAGDSDSGKSGKAGDITNITISDIAAIRIEFGAGVAGAGLAGAGKGGTVSNFKLSGSELGTLGIYSGTGGASARSATDGGDVKNIVADITHIGLLEIDSGGGGSGTYWSDEIPNVSGKNGGSISNILVLHKDESAGLKFESSNSVDRVEIHTGEGGFGLGTGSGGNGGSISDIYVPVTTRLTIEAGAGGDARDHDGELKKYGLGGSGGSINKVAAFVQLAQDDPAPARIEISAGDAGEGGKGSGGSISGLVLASRQNGASSVEVSAGKGSRGFDGSGYAGGNGGNLSDAVVFLPEIDTVEFIAGRGGYGADASGTQPHLRGGAGGSGGFVNTVFVFSANVNSVEMRAGSGGDGTGSGFGGAGGYMNGITLSGMFDEQAPDAGVFDSVILHAGYGGDTDAWEELNVRGGNGGNLTNVNGPSINTFKSLDLEYGGGGWGSREALAGKEGKFENIWIEPQSTNS